MGNKIPWIRVFVEGVVIVVSILFAFGIDAWWSGKQEQGRRVELLLALRSDFIATRDGLEVRLVSADAILSRSQGFRRWSSGEVSLPADSVRALAQGLSRGMIFTAAVPHYDAALSSGEIRLIRSDSILAYLGYFDAGRARLEEHRELSGQIFYLGPMNQVRLDFGSQGGFLNGPDYATAGRSNSVRAAAQAVSTVQANTYSSLETMHEASRHLVAYLDLLLRE